MGRKWVETHFSLTLNPFRDFRETPSRDKLYPPPPSPHFWPKGIFQGRGVGGVYFEAPRGRNFIRLFPFYTPPTPRRVFSPGVLRSKDFFVPIFVVFRDFCKSYFWHPYFYRVFRDFRWFSVILVFLVTFDNFGDFGQLFFAQQERERERERKKRKIEKKIVKLSERKKERKREKERKKERKKTWKEGKEDKGDKDKQKKWERCFSFFPFWLSETFSPTRCQKHWKNKADFTTIKTSSQSSTSSLCASSLFTSCYVMSSNYFVCSSLAILHL